MIKYRCEKCNNLECETSTCPVCLDRAMLFKSEVYYCSSCNVPSFSKNCYVCYTECYYIGTDVRPVFARERLLIETLIDSPMKYEGLSVWNTGGSNYYVNGKKLKLSYAQLRKKDSATTIEVLMKYEMKNTIYVESDCNSNHIKNFIEVNKLRYNDISLEATKYISKISSEFDHSSIFVSFSGGKDSTVVSDLVLNAMNNPKIMHIYSDTTLEYPETDKYIQEYRKTYPKTPLLVGKNNDQNFYNLCDVLGPPSRVMRWCCTIFKTGSIAKKIEQLFKDKKRLLSFQGIRRSESSSRSKYDRETDSPKIAKQKVAAPIIDWLDFDVWLYILTRQIPFNNAYRQGFSRVGCWCCPNNSSWSEYLSSIYMNEQYTAFRNSLYTFAQKIGKPDWRDYIEDGKWKARQGGNGLEHSDNAVVVFKPCVLDNDTHNFELKRPLNSFLYTLLIPFGKIDFKIGNTRLHEVYVLDNRTNEPLLKISGKPDGYNVKFTILNTQNIFINNKVTERYLKNQITKFQTCIGCTNCQSVCKFNAMKIINTKPGDVSKESIEYIIDSNKCVRCLKCVTNFDGGCYMKKVLRTKEVK